MFEADKDVVYLDYGAITIVEKTGRNQGLNSAGPAPSEKSQKEEGGPARAPPTKGSDKNIFDRRPHLGLPSWFQK